MLLESEKERVFVLDTLNAAAGQALLVLSAIELIQEQREIEEIKNLIPKTHTQFIFEGPKGVESIGRITKSQANWIRRIKRIGIHPLMELKEGALGKGGIIFAKNETEALFKKIQKATKKQKEIRIVINQADNLEGAEKLKQMLKEIGAEVSFISEGPPIICAVTVPGTLIVGRMHLEM